MFHETSAHPMDIQKKLPLLAHLSPQEFMQRHWQKKPLLIRQAIPGFQAPVSRTALFDLAAQEAVESRLIVQALTGKPVTKSMAKPKVNLPARASAVSAWQLSHGPFARRALPPLTQKQWTLLVQGVDTHHPAVHQLLQQFRFVPDARLDDVMVSFATEGGGVGPHFDSYDVFLLQAQGRRRWRIGQQKDFSLCEDVPLKILANFEHEEEFVLEPGDMLYLPPRYAHDGVALDECMTYSIGFRAPDSRRLGLELMQLMVDEMQEDLEDEASHPTAKALNNPAKTLYRDPRQLAVEGPAAVPASLLAFAAEAVEKAMQQAHSLPRLLGESLTEPKPKTWFEAAEVPAVLRRVELDRGTRMMYDALHVFINGESYRAAGKDATLMRKLADERALSARDVGRASEAAHDLLFSWCDAGWVHGFADNQVPP